MNDTPKAVQELHRTLLMRRSGAERLKMGCDMFDTSRTLIRASLKDQVKTPREWVAALLERTYGQDFSAETLAKITDQIMKLRSRHGRQ